MLWKYTLFELKILLRSRKQWILGLVLILFFPLFFHYYHDTEQPTAQAQKEEEKSHLIAALDIVPEDLRDTPEGQDIYDNLTQQLSAINMQIYYVFSEPEDDYNYVEDGILLNELRLDMHEKGNPYIPDYFIVPKEEIEEDNAFLTYLRDLDLKVENNPFVTSHYLLETVQFMSGLLIVIYILLVGSNMLVYEDQHDTLFGGLPISFMKKAMSKISVHFVFIITCLAAGVGIGIYRSNKIEGFGDFIYPIVIHTRDGFEVISLMKYFGYVLFAFLIVVLLVLSLALLLEVIFRNIYATVLAGIGLFILPDLLQIIGLKAKFAYPLKYTDITAVLSGEVAKEYGAPYIDYWHSVTWLILFTIFILAIVYIQNKLSFDRTGDVEK